MAEEQRKKGLRKKKIKILNKLKERKDKLIKK